MRVPFVAAALVGVLAGVAGVAVAQVQPAGPDVRGLRADGLKCFRSAEIGAETLGCTRADFIFPQPLVGDPTAARLALTTAPGARNRLPRRVWVRTSAALFYTERLGDLPSARPEVGGARVQTPSPDSTPGVAASQTTASVNPRGLFGAARLQGFGLMSSPLGASVDGQRGPFLSQILIGPVGAPNGVGAFSLGTTALGVNAAALSMPVVESRLAALVAALDARWPIAAGTPVRVVVVADSGYASLARPDGTIIVSHGLLAQARSDDEVAFAIAHEYAHIRLNHFAGGKRRQADSRQAQAAQTSADQAAFALIRGGQAAGTSANGTDAPSPGWTISRAEADELMLSLRMASWSRAVEDEADAAAFDLLTRAGYCPSPSSQAVFVRIDAQLEKLSDRLTTAIRDVPPPAANGSSDSFARALNQFRNGVLEKLREQSLQLRDAHRSVRARIAFVERYADTAYPGQVVTCPPRTTWLASVQGDPRFREAGLALSALAEGRERQAKGDQAGAMAAYLPLTVTALANQPPFVTELARAYRQSGDLARAEALYVRGERSPRVTPQHYLDHLDLLVGAGRYADAKRLIGEALQRFSDPVVAQSLRPSAITIALQTADIAGARAELEACFARRKSEEMRACASVLLTPLNRTVIESLPLVERPGFSRFSDELAPPAELPASKPLGPPG